MIGRKGSAMRAFEISVNGKIICVAGLESGVLTAILSWVRDPPDPEFASGRDELEFNVGGRVSLSPEGSEDLSWIKQPLKVGDTVGIRIVDVENIDEPVTRERDDPKLVERSQRAFYERMKRKFEE